jgi:signal transduction histidine kinase
MESLYFRAKNKHVMKYKFINLFFKSISMFYFLLFFCLITSIEIKSESVFTIENMDISNEISSPRSGNWEVTTEKIDPKEYYNKWKEGNEPKIDWKPYFVPGNLSDIYPTPFPKGFTVFIKKEIVLPKDWNSTHISLFIQRIWDRDRTYFNGEKIGGLGRFGSDTVEASYLFRIYDIPNEVLQKGEKNLILIEVQNYLDFKMGILVDNIEIGPSSIIYQDYQNTENLKFSMYTIYFTFSILFFFVYSFQRENLEYLFFGLFNLLFAIYQFTLSQKYTDFDIPYIFIWHLVYYLLPFVFLTFSHFLLRYFHFKYSLFHKFLDGAIFILTLYILYKREISISIIVWSRVHIIIYILYLILCLYYLVIRFRENNSDAKLMLYSFLILIPAVLTDFMINLGIIQLPFIISPFFFFLFDTSLAIVLTNNIEKMRKNIEDLNSNLENKVLQRTQELHQSLQNIQKLKATEDNLHFIIGVSLKETVNDLRDYTNILLQLEFVESEDRQSVINAIYANSEELYLTLENLISWTRIQSEELTFQISSISIRELFLKSIGNLKDKSIRKQINLKIDISELQINTDPDLLTFILRKIFSNALEFTPENGSITFSSIINGKDLYIICEDNGNGIEKERVHKLENEIEFESSDDYISIKSTGLGMKICNRYIKMLKGSLKIESELGRGTKVTIRLPNSV